MIAYNHYIKFIPELRENEESDDFCNMSVTVRESTLSDFDLKKKLKFELIFPESQGRDLTLHSDAEFNAVEENQFWAFEIKGVVTFYWYSGTMELKYIRYDDFTEKLLKYWVLHVVLPTFFIIEGIYDFLHAGAVEIGENPILFIAPSMGGKSTITDYFMKQGHMMISDDKVATFQKNGFFYAIPSYYYHRPYRDKEDLGLFVNNFAQIPKKMHIVYALEAVEKNEEVRIKLLSGIEKYQSLRDAKEMNLFFHESTQFNYLSKIAQKLSVFKVMIPWDINRLDEVYDAIILHQYNLKDSV